MASLETNVRQAGADFTAIKEKIVANGVEVAEGTRTAEYAQKVDEVYEAGKKAEYDEFWDAHQANGTRKNYANTFACWALENIYPKYDMKPTTTYMMFRAAGGSTGGYLDLAERLDECGVILDTSECSTHQYMFYESRITRVGVIDTRGAASLNDIFDYSSIQTIDKLILRDDGSQTISGTFKACSELINIVIEGVIGQNGYNLRWSTKLSKASITSIINALSTTTEGLTVTLSKAAVNKAFETSEGANDGEFSAEWNELEKSREDWTISLV